MKYQTTQALVLRQADWRENDRLVTVYTKDFGKVAYVCLGAKRGESKLGGHLQPFCVTEIEVVNGRQLSRIINVSTFKQYPSIKQDLAKMLIGYFFIEVVDELVEAGLPDDKLFNMLDDFFSALNIAEAGKLRLLRSVFIFQFLNHLGYRISDQDCGMCQQVLTPDNNFYHLNAGIICDSCDNGEESMAASDDLIKILRLVNSSPLEDLLKLSADSKIIDEIGQVSLKQIYYRLEKPLQSMVTIEYLTLTPKSV